MKWILRPVSALAAFVRGRPDAPDGVRPRPAVLVAAVLAVGLLVAGYRWLSAPAPWSPKDSQLAAQWRRFVAEKAAQEEALAVEDEKPFKLQYDRFWASYPWYERLLKMYVYRENPPGSLPHQFQRTDCRPFFAAAARGDWQTVTNLYTGMNRLVFGGHMDGRIGSVIRNGGWWEPVKETYGALEQLANGDEKYALAMGREIINSIPPGSLFFGGAEPGGILVPVLSGSPGAGRQIFTFNQNELANGAYLLSLHSHDEKQVYIPSNGDLVKSFTDYTEDVQRRQKAGRLQMGEEVHIDGDGRAQVSGQPAVMMINGLLVKTMFDHNPNRELYLEESYPLEWTYPNLEPHSLILKINRQPLATLPDALVRQDHDYWTNEVTPMIGGWLNDDTPLPDVTAFANRVFLQHDFSGFQGDPAFVKNKYSTAAFSKLRCSIAGLYAWRMHHAGDEAEKARMSRAADFAYRQALALCPSTPGTVYRYVNYLLELNRPEDALLVAQTALKLDPTNGSFVDLVEQLKERKQQVIRQTQDMDRVRQMEALTQADPGNLTNLMTFGNTYVEMNNTNRAVEVFGMAFTNSNITAENQIQIADYFSQTGNLGKLDRNSVEEVCDAALNRTNITVWEAAQITHIFSRLGNMNKLERALQKVVVLAPAEPEPRFDLAEVETILGRTNSALQDLRLALDLDRVRPDSERTEWNLLDEIRTNKDLDSLRNLPAFQTLAPAK